MNGRREGFTLIELLVVIAIIAVLIALLLPAVQSSREAARRVQCVNNMMQLNLALQNYESAFEAYPPGVTDARGPISNTPKGQHHGWMVRILPYLDLKNAANRFNFDVSVYDARHLTVRAIHLNVMTCPSDAANSMISESSYAGCHNDVEAPIDATNNGLLILNRSIARDEVTDGAAYTILLGEKRRIGNTLGWASGTRATLRNTGITPNGPIGELIEVTYRPPIDTSGLPPDVAEMVAELEEVGDDLDDPRVEADAEPKAPTMPAGLVGGFSSPHHTGANFAFGDGSIRFLKNSINPKVFRNLGNRADGELLGDDMF